MSTFAEQKIMLSRNNKRKREIRSIVVRGAHFRLRNYTEDRQKHIENLRRYLKNSNIRCSSFEIPDELESAVDFRLSLPEKINFLKLSSPSIFEPLSKENYVTRMQTLVFLEEIHHRQQYESPEQQLVDCFVYYDEMDDLYHVDGVPNLRCILIGGEIYLTSDDFFELRGTIVEVYDGGFSFDSSDDIDDDNYDIQFVYSRTNTRKQLFSIGKVLQKFGFPFLFPSEKSLKPSAITVNTSITLNWFHSDLNTFQKTAVKNIIHGHCRPLPYIIFGPPGTGKTITLIEAVCQVATLIDKSIILVAAPSNKSADAITEHLAQHLVTKKFLRLSSVNYFEKGLIPCSIKKYSISIKDISDDLLKIYKVVIGTCSTLAGLHFHNLPTEYFTHVFIDEAGRCTEPEIMNPISLVNKQNGQITLFGDPMQLGPIILSHLCKSPTSNDRLERSFLERLMELPLYMENGNQHDPHLVTKLIYNYRSIPSVLHGYNSLFYGNQLINVKTNDNDITRLFRDMFGFQSDEDHGLYFFDIRGNTSIMNLSYFNNSEAAAVVNCANKLLSNGIKLHQIGIITPYSAQIEVITNIFIRDDVPFIGTIEGAQGLEFDIVLFSSVRTENFGFIDGKRLNVAISRAKYLLVIFGREFFLSKDLDWSTLIAYCENEEAFGEDLAN